MQIKEVLQTVEYIDKMHYTPDGYLAYGEYQDDKFYALTRIYQIGNYGFQQEVMYPSIKQAKEVNPEVEMYMCIWYVPRQDMLSLDTLVYVFPRSRNLYGNVLEELAPDGYYFYGITVQAGISIIDINKYNQMASTLVSFNNGPNNSKLPILWRVDKPYTKVPVYDVYLKDDTFLFDRDVFMRAINTIKKDLPPVDLDTDADSRYVTLEVDDGVYFMYNRNHVAYNGASSTYEEFAPLMLWALAEFYDTVGFENFTSFIMNDMKDESVLIRRIGDNEVVEPAPAKEGFMNMPLTGEEFKEYKHEDNILLRAARASDTDYR